MLNRASSGSAVFELAISLALIIGIGAGAYILQHTPSKNQAAQQSILAQQ
jgi:hypothetical protein